MRIIKLTIEARVEESDGQASEALAVGAVQRHSFSQSTSDCHWRKVVICLGDRPNSGGKSAGQQQPWQLSWPPSLAALVDVLLTAHLDACFPAAPHRATVAGADLRSLSVAAAEDRHPPPLPAASLIGAAVACQPGRDLGGRAHAELREDPRAVDLDRAHRNAQLVGDHLVELAGGHA